MCEFLRNWFYCNFILFYFPFNKSVLLPMANKKGYDRLIESVEQLLPCFSYFFLFFVYIFFFIFNCFCFTFSNLVASYTSFFSHFLFPFFIKQWGKERERQNKQICVYACLHSRHCMTTNIHFLNFMCLLLVLLLPFTTVENPFPFTCSQFQSRVCNCVSFVQNIHTLH